MTRPLDSDGRPPMRETNAAQLLKTWYGPRSLACHTVEEYDGKIAVAKFVVPQDLCGPQARPPMYDKLTFQNGVYIVQTVPEDAPEHWIDLQVIPGHSTIGLVVRGLEEDFYRGKKQRGHLYPTDFDYIKFRNFNFPGHEIAFATETKRTRKQITGSATMEGQERPFTEEFRCEEGGALDPEAQRNLFEWDWVLETTAQGVGVIGLKDVPKGVKPILISFGPSHFEKMIIRAKDVITSRFKNIDADAENVSGDAEVFVNGKQFAELQEVMLGFVSTEFVEEQAAKMRS